MTAVCPDGHRTESTDYCDVCGLPVAGTLLGGVSGRAGARGPAAPPSPPSAPPATTFKPCPNCGVESPSGALFCEECGISVDNTRDVR